MESPERDPLLFLADAVGDRSVRWLRRGWPGVRRYFAKALSCAAALLFLVMFEGGGLSTAMLGPRELVTFFFLGIVVAALGTLYLGAMAVALAALTAVGAILERLESSS